MIEKVRIKDLRLRGATTITGTVTNLGSKVI
jgi:hypothetical protein